MTIKTQVTALHERITIAFEQQATGATLVEQMTQGVDALIVEAWQNLAPNAALRADLVAVGGYGRGDLAPRSDWDVSILLPKGDHADLDNEIALFLRSLWDAGGKVGASTRNLKQTIEHMQEDVNTATAALESRLLAGNGEQFRLYEKKIRRYFQRRRKSFIEEKLEEMHTRHKKNGDTAFLMEPDIKENRGGLRDIHSVFWIARAWYDEQSIAGLQRRGAISERECSHLLTAQDFLWRCRTFMHLQSRRGSDRLSFEMQAMLADAMGYDANNNRPMVELFMKDFFRHSGRIARVSHLLMMHFQEQLQPKVFSIIWPLDNGFSLHAQRVSIQHERVFKERPLRLLEIFHEAQQDRRRLSSTALRQVRADVMLIDNDFRAKPEAKNIFLAILRHPRNVATVLREMNDTGVLGRFVPLFRHTVGLGQFNRYHAYTVDEHTLRAIAEARLFFHRGQPLKLLMAGDVAGQIKRPELLYLALLFHDIAKGKEGDHSLVGAPLAYDYCLSLGLHQEQASFVAWLVEMHLVMAITSQRFDLSEPDVIQSFAQKVSDKERLNYLFLLTVADITAVGPTVWNDWKGGLLMTLYRETAHYLLRGNDLTYGISERANGRIAQTLELASKGEQASLQTCLQQLPHRALMHYLPEELLLLSRTLAAAGNHQYVHAHFDQKIAIFAIVANERQGLFASLAEVLSSGCLDVLRAQAFALPNKRVLDVFYVRSGEGVALMDDDLLRLKKRINSMIEQPCFSGSVRRCHYKHHVLMEQVIPNVRLLPQASTQQTVFEVTAADRPGLLAKLAGIISAAKMVIRGASVSTFGEKAVDVFFVTTVEGGLLDEPFKQQLRQDLLKEATISPPHA